MPTPTSLSSSRQEPSTPIFPNAVPFFFHGQRTVVDISDLLIESRLLYALIPHVRNDYSAMWIPSLVNERIGDNALIDTLWKIEGSNGVYLVLIRRTSFK